MLIIRISPSFRPDWWTLYTKIPPFNRVDPSRRKVCADALDALCISLGILLILAVGSGYSKRHVNIRVRNPWFAGHRILLE